jgi:hypothetical protein
VEWNNGMVERCNSGMMARCMNDPVPFLLIIGPIGHAQVNWSITYALSEVVVVSGALKWMVQVQILILLLFFFFTFLAE